MVKLFPNFGSGGEFVSFWIVGVFKLIDVVAAALLGDTLGKVVVIFGMTLAHVAASDNYLNAKGFEMVDFFGAHLVGNHKEQLVALQTTCKRETEPCVARRSLNNKVAGMN